MASSVKVYSWNWSDLSEEKIESFQLPESDLKKLQDITSSKRKKEFLTGRYLIRQAAESSAEILYTEMGKPYFSEGPSFSLSHSNGRSLLVVSTEDVGADIQLQDAKRSKDEIIKNYALSSEKEVYDSLETDELKNSYFFQLWGLKEAFCKATGTGINEEFRHLQITDYDQSNEYVLYSFIEDDYQNSVCAKTTAEKPEFYKTLLENNGFLSFHISPPTAEVKALSVLGR